MVEPSGRLTELSVLVACFCAPIGKLRRLRMKPLFPMIGTIPGTCNSRRQRVPNTNISNLLAPHLVVKPRLGRRQLLVITPKSLVTRFKLGRLLRRIV